MKEALGNHNNSQRDAICRLREEMPQILPMSLSVARGREALIPEGVSSSSHFLINWCYCLDQSLFKRRNGTK